MAVVNSWGQVLAMRNANQDDTHRPFGGVVPEIAGRRHMEDLLPLIDQLLEESEISWDEIQGLAVTNRPGLVGSLIVGLVTAKSLALALQKPFLGVHHIEGHVLSGFLSDEPLAQSNVWQEPFLALAVSGGHTHLYHCSSIGTYKELGKTVDDAAGEAFDKLAKMLGIGYPGGLMVDRQAQKGDAKKYAFPRSFIKEDHYNMSFSGLKSSAHRLIHGKQLEEQMISDICASYQEAIVDVLITKLSRAMKEFGLKKMVIAGGVSANSRLRRCAQELAQKEGYELKLPALKYCTDNAAMIGLVGALRLAQGEESEQSLAPHARAPLGPTE